MSNRKPWLLYIIALPAAVAIWSGWVGLGQMAGFGLVKPLPGLLPWHLDTAITLPVGIEAYGVYALREWLTATPGTPDRTRRFAMWSAVGSLVLGALGQVAFHLLAAAGAARAPWPVVVLVSCVPVAVVGLAAALTHLMRLPAGAAKLTDTGPTERSAVAATEPTVRPEDMAGTGVGIGPDTVADTCESPDGKEATSGPHLTGQDGGHPPGRTPRQNRARRGDRLDRLIAANPDMTTANLARKAGVSERTVTRRRAAGRAVIEGDNPDDTEGTQLPRLTRVQ